MLPELAAEARSLMRAALTPADVAPLLWRAQAECEAEALQLVFEWAVDHFEEVAAKLDCWLGALPAAPREARELGADALSGMHEQLRVAMLQSRYGL